MNYNDWYFSKYTHIDPSFYAFGEMAWQAAQAAAKKHQCQPVCVFHEGNEIARLQAENVELRKREEWFANLFERKWNGVVGAGTRYTYHLRGDWRHMVGALSGDTLSAAIDAAMKGVSDGN